MYLFRNIRSATSLKVASFIMASLILAACTSPQPKNPAARQAEASTPKVTEVQQAPNEKSAAVSDASQEKVPDELPTSSRPDAGSKITTAQEDETPAHQVTDKEQALAIKLCKEIGSKLGSVTIADCLRQQLIHSDLTTQGRSLAYREYPPVDGRTALGKVLVIGGIHGDEFSSVSVLFKWMNILNKHHSGLFHWRFVPAMNPDGLLRKKSQRQNHNGVDLNRNFPTTDWEEDALAHWRTETHNNPRRHPGLASASEPEIKWLVQQIATFKPDVIISMHAPYHLVDYDGPPTAPNKLGSLYLRDLGVFPGSLGNYAGIDLNVPIVTVELKSAGIMPPDNEIDTMWSDLVRWLQDQLSADISDYETSEDVSELSVGQ